jgi:hypothetical protein
VASFLKDSHPNGEIEKTDKSSIASKLAAMMQITSKLMSLAADSVKLAQQFGKLPEKIKAQDPKGLVAYCEDTTVCNAFTAA